MNGLERGPDLKKKDITALHMCVFPSLLGCKFSETAISTLKWDIGLLLVSLSSPGMSPWKDFIVYMKEDTSHLYLFPCRSWLPLYYRRKLNWDDYMLFKKKKYCLHFVYILYQSSLRFLSSCWLFAWWSILGDTREWQSYWLAYQLGGISLQKTFYFGYLSFKMRMIILPL